MPGRGRCHCGAYDGAPHFGVLYLNEDGCLRDAKRYAVAASFPSSNFAPAVEPCVDAVDAGYFAGPVFEYVPQTRPEPPPPAAGTGPRPPAASSERPTPRHVARRRTKAGRQLAAAA